MENTLKKDKKKHDHKLTKLLKVGIFSIVMLAPFIAVGTSCAYMTFNKNATMPTQQENVIVQKTYETNEITQYSDFIEGNIYKYDITAQNGDNEFYTNKIYVQDTIFEGNFKIYENIIENIDEQTTYNMGTTYAYFIFKEGANTYDQLGTINISDYLPTYYTTETQEIYNNINVFYYAINEIENNELFNWTQNTAIYSGIYGLTNGMGNNNPTIAILLTYWTITTCIYVIFDIVIELFTWLTHLIGER